MKVRKILFYFTFLILFLNIICVKGENIEYVEYIKIETVKNSNDIFSSAFEILSVHFNKNYNFLNDSIFFGRFVFSDDYHFLNNFYISSNFDFLNWLIVNKIFYRNNFNCFNRSIYLYNFLIYNYFDYLNNNYGFYNIYGYKRKSNYIYNNYLYIIKKYTTEVKESKLRRAEILFFISIPFIYIYVNNLMRFNNFLIYGNFDREFDEYQKRVLYVTFIVFGFDVIYNNIFKKKR